MIQSHFSPEKSRASTESSLHILCSLILPYLNHGVEVTHTKVYYNSYANRQAITSVNQVVS